MSAERNAKLKEFDDAALIDEVLARQVGQLLLDKLDDVEISDEFNDRGITHHCQECEERIDVDEADLWAAFIAMDASTPEPIRDVLAALNGRIA